MACQLPLEPTITSAGRPKFEKSPIALAVVNWSTSPDGQPELDNTNCVPAGPEPGDMATDGKHSVGVGVGVGVGDEVVGEGEGVLPGVVAEAGPSHDDCVLPKPVGSPGVP